MSVLSTASSPSTALPLHAQIREALIREIAAGRFSSGERLPPERVLAQQFATSVRTLRKALAELEQQGFLERVHGSGNYVRETDIARGIYSLFRLERPEGGGAPTARILEVTERVKPEDLPRFGTAERATRLRRIRMLDGVAVAAEEIWLDRDCGAIDAAALPDSLYQYYRDALGFWIRRIEDRVTLASLPGWAGPALDLAQGGAVGYIERLSWAQRQAPVEFSRSWFHPARARYVQRLS